MGGSAIVYIRNWQLVSIQFVRGTEALGMDNLTGGWGLGIKAAVMDQWDVGVFFFFCRERVGDELVLLIILAGGAMGDDSCKSKSAYGFSARQLKVRHLS